MTSPALKPGTSAASALPAGQDLQMHTLSCGMRVAIERTQP
jgi:hypothetical protein